MSITPLLYIQLVGYLFLLIRMIMFRVGVTGVGGGVGQSIIKALQMSDLTIEIVAIDITDSSAEIQLF